MPQISVIMGVYKEPKEYLILSIESILNQTFSDLEYIIVIDDPDNVEAQEVIEEYRKKDSRIIVIKNERNLGLVASLNRALSEAKGNFIARMDADDISDMNRFEEQLKYLRQNSLDLVGCSLRRISETGKVITKMANRSYCQECISETLLIDDCIAHPSWFGKYSIFVKLKGYRDFYSCEDYDFLLRALHIGAKLGVCDKILMSYRINTRGISRTNSLRQHLSSKFLKENYEHIENITQFELERIVEKRNTKVNAQLYKKALQIFNIGLDDLKKKKVSGIMRLLYAPLVSPYIIDKYRRIYKIRKIRKRYINLSKSDAVTIED